MQYKQTIQQNTEHFLPKNNLESQTIQKFDDVILFMVYNNLRPLAMSRQEIDRILSDDFAGIDRAINQQMSALDLLTGKITENSGFLSQFQMLLQKELSKKDKVENISEKKEEKQKEACSQLAEDHEQSKTTTPRIQIEDAQLRQQCLQTQPNYPSPNITCSKCDKILNILQNEVQILQTTTVSLQKFIREQFLKEKNIFLSIFEANIKQIIGLSEQRFQSLIEKLIKQNEELKSQIQTFHSQARKPLSVIRVNEEEPCLSRDWIGESSSKKQPSEQSFLFQLKSSRKDPSYSLCFEAPPLKGQHHDTGVRLNKKMESFQIPEIKVVKVGVPPVTNGFGILKSGQKVVYKGMWKGGKFNGKGKLTWNNYSYEGDFKEGHFHGYGRLQFEKGIFLGKFQTHKAQGEGTLTFENNQVYGLWQNNRLVQSY